MAWIESHQALERHPKTLDLMTSMGWDLSQTIGNLHRFWWWCVDYAEDGDLRKHGNRYAIALGMTGETADKFVTEMRRISFIDTDPYLRVHDWWHYHGYSLRAKYRQNKEKWERVRELHAGMSTTLSTTPSGTSPHTDIPLPTDIHLPTNIQILCRQIVAYLNEKTGRKYDPDRKSTVSKISARIKEGFTLDDALAVIDTKWAEWGASDKMRKFVRPETLFAPSHFEDYLQEAKERKGVKDGKGADAGTDKSDPRADRKAKLRAAAKPVDMQ